ncbi:MAG: hypothetical protein LBB85_07235 [Dysgonamonadaceae bacterium]|jgi:hypothetical protein|nr:hypothetical protein [Dysgonamonadaceae bacterium]
MKSKLCYLIVLQAILSVVWGCSDESNYTGSSFTNNNNINPSDITYDIDQLYCDGNDGGSGSGNSIIFFYDNSFPMDVVFPEYRCEVKFKLRKSSNGSFFANDFSFNTYNIWYRHKLVSYAINQYTVNNSGTPISFVLSVTYQEEEKRLILNNTDNNTDSYYWVVSGSHTIVANFVHP